MRLGPDPQPGQAGRGRLDPGLRDDTTEGVDQGCVMGVGMGIDPQGQEQGWVVTIPEPATLVLLQLGVLALIKRRKQSCG